jgi:hypothetical protein
MSLTEHMEHAAHAGHGHDHKSPSHGDNPLPKRIGITMAMLGALLALCSAMLGGARNELISTMVEQASVGVQAQSVSTKYRTLMAQLQQLHALMPADEKEFEATDKKIETIEAANQKTGALAPIQVMRLETDKILNTVTPSASDVLHFVKIVRHYQQEKELAVAWRESYNAAIVAHEHGAEHYEWALLCAEFGIVLCSVALLLTNRRAWQVAIALGALGLGLGGWSFNNHHHHVAEARIKITETKAAYTQFNKGGDQSKDDNELLSDIERIESRHTPVKAP